MYYTCRRTDDEGHVPQEVIELIQSGIDEVLEEKVERTHLTANHVKNIIKVKKFLKAFIGSLCLESLPAWI